MTVLVAVASMVEHWYCAGPVTGLQVLISQELVGGVRAICGFEHAPVAGLQVPAEWHASLAVHVTPVPVHVPFVHASFEVQALLSLHVVPFAAAGFEHEPLAGLQVPATWH